MKDGLDGLTPVDPPALTEADVIARVWRFGPAGGAAYADHLRLLDGGRIGFHLQPAEKRWRLENGRLMFLDGDNRRTTLFDKAWRDGDERLVLGGRSRFLPEDGPLHLLREREPLDALHPPGVEPATVERDPGVRRPNLLLVSGNDASLHPKWLRNLDDEDRTWDFALKFYGDLENSGKDPYADIQFDGRGRKFPSLHTLFHEGSRFWDYEYIGLCDDDLLVTWRDLNRLFATCREFDLWLAQPSLSRDSHIAHAVTKHQPNYRLRYVSFVEAMFPVFHRDALRICMPSFGQAVLGHGVDNIWPKLLGEPQNRLAVIDDVQVKHTRPFGAKYDVEQFIKAGLELQDRYNAPSRVLQYGGVMREPKDMQWWALEARGETV